MKWLKRKIAQWAEQGQEMNYNCTEKVGTPVMDETRFGRPLNVSMYNAVGGKILRFNSYDEKTDRQNETVYVIHADESLEEVLPKFMAMEALKF